MCITGFPYFTNNAIMFNNIWVAAILVVSINTGAYMAESVRGGIMSIDPGQTEGAKAIGMNHFQTMVYVILPQALRNIMPQIGNNFIINVKDSSVMFIISFTEFFAAHRAAVGATYQYFPSATIEMIGYLCMTLIASSCCGGWRNGWTDRTATSWLRLTSWSCQRGRTVIPTGEHPLMSTAKSIRTVPDRNPDAAGERGEIMSGEAILEIRHLSKAFGNNEVLKDIDFTVRPGDVTSIIGASGSGKSTLLRCINLLETPTGGEILFHGESITGKGVNASGYRAKVGMVFQSFNLFNNMTVLENCVVGQVKVSEEKERGGEGKRPEISGQGGHGALYQREAPPDLRRTEAESRHCPRPCHGTGGAAL